MADQLRNEFESTAEEIDFHLLRVSEDGLKAIATGLNLKCEPQHSKRQLRRLLSEFTQKLMEEAQEDGEEAKRTEGLNNLKMLLQSIIQRGEEESKSITSSTEDKAVKEPGTASTPKGAEPLSSTTKMPDVTAAVGKDIFLSGLYQDPTSVLRKELKIRGQIGEPRAKDKLSYVSLIHQMNEAQQCGYHEREIISAVVRAMTPGLPLRGVLETKTDLTLPQLHQFLEAHYDEKSATELCNKLSGLVQSPDESAYNFIIRCIELRQKLILASGKSGGVTYDKSFIHQIFYRTVENGLTNRHIVHDIRQLIKTAPDDQLLIAEITKLASYEKERGEVQGRSKSKALKVHSAQENQTEKSVLALANAVATLTEKVNMLMENNQQPPRKRFSRCEECKRNNKDRCNHCFKCCSPDHLAKDCRGNK